MRITIITSEEVRPSEPTQVVLRRAVENDDQVLDWTGLEDGTIVRLREDGSHEFVSPDAPNLIFQAVPFK